ncbi:pyruvate kinase [candidate division KSB1 bacterium]
MKIRKTKIVATLGPASSSPAIIRRLVKQGVDVFRFNFSHSSHEFVAETAALIHGIASELNRQIALLGDLQGPRVRLGRLEKRETLELRRGEIIELIPSGEISGHGRIPVDYPNLTADIVRGDRILINDGLVELKVLEVMPDSVRCRVVRGGEISDHKGLTLPSNRLSLPFLSSTDRKDIDFAITVGLDFLALSFVRRVSDIDDVLAYLGARTKKLGLIAKIESPEAIKNIDRLLPHVGGVMIARGDLAVEYSLADIPILQKILIGKAREQGLPVITATQMLESMVENPTPTRAEATDIANAVLDGSDALMLSAESAVGAYPVEAVRTMNSIAGKVEESSFWRPGIDFEANNQIAVPEALARAAALTGWDIRAKAIVAFTLSGRTAAALSNERPRLPVFALTPDKAVARRLALYSGVIPLVCPLGTRVEEMIHVGEQVLLESTGLKIGDRVVLIHGTTPFTGGTNLIKVHILGHSEK